MGRKILFAAALFVAGFATALYLVAPVSESQTGQGKAIWTEPTLDQQRFRQELLAVSCKIHLGMNKLIGFAEEQSIRLAEYVREKYTEHQAKNG